MAVEKQLEFQDVQQTFLTALNGFAKQLNDLTEDMKAIEVVTAVGTTTADILSSQSDITNIANGKGANVTGNLTILARTRLELDGDLLVILPTKQTKSLPTSGGTQTDTNKEKIKEEPTSVQTSEPVEIDKEILNLHKENVNMALQNLQFVYGKVMDIASKFVEGTGKGNIFSNIFAK
jgi:hypothetical protein